MLKMTLTDQCIAEANLAQENRVAIATVAGIRQFSPVTAITYCSSLIARLLQLEYARSPGN